MTKTKTINRNELLKAVENIDAKAVFASEESIAAKIAEIQAEVGKQSFDISTPEGRKICDALAYQVTRAKTAMDNKGKELVEDAKRIVKMIDPLRKKARDELEAYAIEVRRPYTEFEAEEARIKAKLEADFNAIGALVSGIHSDSSIEDIERAMEELATRFKMRNEPWGDYESRAKEAIESAERTLSMLLDGAKFRKMQAEAAAIEAAKRQEEIDREMVRQAEIRADEQKAAQAAAEVLAKQRAQEAALKKAEDDRLAAIAEAERQKEAAAERERLVAEEHARALEEAAEAKRKAEQDAKDAIEKERLRVKAEQDAIAEAERKRAADKEHRRTIMLEAGRAMMEAMPGLTNEQLRGLFSAIVEGKIPHIRIQF